MLAQLLAYLGAQGLFLLPLIPFPGRKRTGFAKNPAHVWIDIIGPNDLGPVTLREPEIDPPFQKTGFVDDLKGVGTLDRQGFLGDGEIPALTDEVRVEAAKRYIQAYELITGEEFVAYDEPIADRLGKALGC